MAGLPAYGWLRTMENRIPQAVRPINYYPVWGNKVSVSGCAITQEPFTFSDGQGVSNPARERAGPSPTHIQLKPRRSLNKEISNLISFVRTFLKQRGDRSKLLLLKKTSIFNFLKAICCPCRRRKAKLILAEGSFSGRDLQLVFPLGSEVKHAQQQLGCS